MKLICISYFHRNKGNSFDTNLNKLSTRKNYNMPSSFPSRIRPTLQKLKSWRKKRGKKKWGLKIVLTFLKSMLSSDKVFRLCQDYGSKLFYLKSYRVSNFSIFKKFIDSLTRLGIETLYNLKIYFKVICSTSSVT